MKLICHNCQQSQNIAYSVHLKCSYCNSEAVQFINQNERQNRNNQSQRNTHINQYIGQRRTIDDIDGLFERLRNRQRSPFSRFEDFENMMLLRNGIMSINRVRDRMGMRSMMMPSFQFHQEGPNSTHTIRYYSYQSPNYQFQQYSEPQVFIEPAAQVKKINVDKYPKLNKIDDECAICHIKENQGLILPCGHQFHKNCLKPWLEMKDNCPTCRFKL